MTTLYRPVLIESAEQAEALPVGTVAYGPETGGLVGIRAPESSYFPWHCSFEHDPTAYSSEVVGWTALVPIEAEEERDAKAEAWDAFCEGLAGHLDLATPRAWGFRHPCDPPGVRWEPTEGDKALMDVADMLRKDTANPYRDTQCPEEAQ